MGKLRADVGELIGYLLFRESSHCRHHNGNGSSVGLSSYPDGACKAVQNDFNEFSRLRCDCVASTQGRVGSDKALAFWLVQARQAVS